MFYEVQKHTAGDNHNWYEWACVCLSYTCGHRLSTSLLCNSGTVNEKKTMWRLQSVLVELQ